MNPNLIALLIFLMATGTPFTYVEDARITSYVPARGGINCDSDCSVGAFSTPIEYGITAACGPSYPWNTRVLIFTPWGDIVERYCQDRGGAITDINVDIAMTPEQHDALPLYGYWPTVWIKGE